MTSTASPYPSGIKSHAFLTRAKGSDATHSKGEQGSTLLSTCNGAIFQTEALDDLETRAGQKLMIYTLKDASPDRILSTIKTDLRSMTSSDALSAPQAKSCVAHIIRQK